MVTNAIYIKLFIILHNVIHLCDSKAFFVETEYKVKKPTNYLNKKNIFSNISSSFTVTFNAFNVPLNKSFNSCVYDYLLLERCCAEAAVAAID